MGNDLQSRMSGNYSNAVGSVELYQKGIRIEITEWDNASNAALFLDGGIRLFEDFGTRITAISLAEEHWFTFTGSGFTLFAWRRGVKAFDVEAPDET